jgi:RNA-directed DNA polymerase
MQDSARAFMSSKIIIIFAWDKIKWPLVLNRVRRSQRRIYKAKRAGLLDKVQWLQKRLLASVDGRLLAVHQVTTLNKGKVTTLNKGKKTADVDKIRMVKPKDKLALARSLTINGKACSDPIRRVWIEKPGKAEMRPLGIPTIRDRAKQMLAKLALEPEWEAVFEPNSYGFRPARRAHDAIEAIFLSLRRHNNNASPKFVFNADIRKCFDRISHDALLNKLGTFPALSNQIRAWLKAGVMEEYSKAPKDILPTEVGTPQGGVISPLLANIALHGLENHLKTFVERLPAPRPGVRGLAVKRKALAVIRYADDFVIIHENRQILYQCIEETSRWLGTIGLEISEEKSSVVDSCQGFKFLGFQITVIRRNLMYRVCIIPEKEKKKRFLARIKSIVQNNRAVSSYDLIRKLRPVIIGWANYYKYCECASTFHTMTHLIFQKIRAWVFRRDTRNGRLAVKQKYFPSGRTYSFLGVTHRDNWILTGESRSKAGKKVENYLPHMVWIPSEKFVKVPGDKSPFDGDAAYWAARSHKFASCSRRI